MQRYNKHIDNPTIAYIFFNKTAIAKYRVYLHTRYISNGRIYPNQKKQIAEFFGIEICTLNSYIKELVKEGLLEKKNGYFDALGKVRFAQRFAYLGKKKFGINEEILKDSKKFRTWLFSIAGENFAIFYGQKKDPITGKTVPKIKLPKKEKKDQKEETTQQTEDKDSIELTGLPMPTKEQEEPQFLLPFQAQSSRYLSKCLKVHPSTANRHLHRAAAFDFIEIQKNIKYVTFCTPDNPKKRQFAGTKQECIDKLNWARTESRFFAHCFVFRDKNNVGYGEGKYYGIAYYDSNTVTYKIPYRKTNQAYSQYQNDELESIRFIKQYDCN